MGHFKNFCEFILENLSSTTGEYSTKDMDKFIKNLIQVFPFNEQNPNSYSSPKIYIPENMMSSSVTGTKSDTVSKWNKSSHLNHDCTWNVSRVTFSDNSQKSNLKYIKDNRIELNSILSLIKKNPNAIQTIHIGLKTNQSGDISGSGRLD